MFLPVLVCGLPWDFHQLTMALVSAVSVASPAITGRRRAPKAVASSPMRAYAPQLCGFEMGCEPGAHMRSRLSSASRLVTVMASTLP